MDKFPQFYNLPRSYQSKGNHCRFYGIVKWNYAGDILRERLLEIKAVIADSSELVPVAFSLIPKGKNNTSAGLFL